MADMTVRFSVGDEGRRFLRYVTPGLVYGLETLLFLLILMPDPTLYVLSKVSIKDNALGTSVAAFFASGALGYIFHAVHHSVHWSRCFSCLEKSIFDHQKVIDRLREARLMPPIGFDGIDGYIKRYEDANDPVKKQMLAESISLALWYHFVESKSLKTDTFDLLGNQAHGLGAARIASVFAFFTTFVIGLYTLHGTPNFVWCHTDTLVRCGAVLILSCCAICVFHGGYRRVSEIEHEAYIITLMKKADVRKKQIAEKAYLRSLSRRDNPGNALDDWLTAEAGVDAKLKINK